MYDIWLVDIGQGSLFELFDVKAITFDILTILLLEKRLFKV